MLDDMGIFRTTIEVALHGAADRRIALQSVMVDTGSEYTWIPTEVLDSLGIAPERIDRFETADGRILERPVGSARVFAGGQSGVTMVVFAGAGDSVLFGAHGLEALNLRVDLGRRELMPAGPLPAAMAA